MALLCRLGLVAVVAATSTGVSFSAARPAFDPTAAAAMERFMARPPIAHQYAASRRLEASTRGRHGWMEVETRFSPASGLHYEVIAEGGSGYIRRRVLRSLLDEEKRLTAQGGTARVAISAANYQFVPEGLTEDGLAVVEMQPRRKERSLIAGRMFLAPSDGDLVRVEGRLARNPSFWVTGVEVVRTYRRISGALMPLTLETTAQIRLLGSSVLRMEYRYSQIDERPVSDANAAGDGT